MSNENITIKEGHTAATSLVFKLNGVKEPIIVINETGFLYKRER